MTLDKIQEFLATQGPFQGLLLLTLGMLWFHSFKNELPKGRLADFCHSMYAQWTLCVILLNFISHTHGDLDFAVAIFQVVTGTIFMVVICYHGMVPKVMQWLKSPWRSRNMKAVDYFWGKLYWLVPESVCYRIYRLAFFISPKLVPESLRPKPIDPLPPREFLVESMRVWRENPKFAGVYASLDGERIDVDDVPKISDEDLDRVVWHNIRLKPRNRAERRRQQAMERRG